MSRDLDAWLAGSPFQGYAYSYPHKTAYRPLDPPRSLREVWAEERREGLFLYLHVPFCAYRCGFCNLFTQTGADPGRVTRYLDGLEAEAEAAQAALGTAEFARLAVGGGTPTFLTAPELERLFGIARGLGADARAIPAGIELSPETATPERIAVLRALGVQRVSVGVQSFVEAEARGAGRPQRTEDVERALERLRDAEFAVFNLDLIYGLPGQTEATWRASLARALAYRPDELFLYPLYVRPKTGLERTGRVESEAEWDARRLRLLRVGVEVLRGAGYDQVSMRQFQRPRAEASAAPRYRCQEDGMVGLGSGARSYTRGLHYSGEWAVGAAGVRAIVDAYLARTVWDRVEYGVELGEVEQRRRYVIQSLLCVEGLERAAYRAWFGGEVGEDLPELGALVARGLAEESGWGWRLTAAGLERSDVIGPWLYSAKVQAEMTGYELR